jgi:hypothetical protein
MTPHRFSRTAALALTLAALGATTAAAQQQDLRSPDARDTASAVTTAAAPQPDLRSPDARDVRRAAADVIAERNYPAYPTPDSPGTVAQERYRPSGGTAEPLTVPESPLPADDTPWLAIALSISGALLIVAATATQLRRLRRRGRIRPTA